MYSILQSTHYICHIYFQRNSIFQFALFSTYNHFLHISNSRFPFYKFLILKSAHYLHSVELEGIGKISFFVELNYLFLSKFGAKYEPQFKVEDRYKYLNSGHMECHKSVSEFFSFPTFYKINTQYWELAL